MNALENGPENQVRQLCLLIFCVSKITHLHTYTNSNTHICICVFVYVCVYDVYMYIYDDYVLMYVYMYFCMYVCIYSYIHTHPTLTKETESQKTKLSRNQWKIKQHLALLQYQIL